MPTQATPRPRAGIGATGRLRGRRTKPLLESVGLLLPRGTRPASAESGRESGHLREALHAAVAQALSPESRRPRCCASVGLLCLCYRKFAVRKNNKPAPSPKGMRFSWSETPAPVLWGGEKVCGQVGKAQVSSGFGPHLNGPARPRDRRVFTQGLMAGRWRVSATGVISLTGPGRVAASPAGTRLWAASSQRPPQL